MKFYLQSFNDIVTNSSMEVYQEATDYTVNSIKEIIDTILKIAQSDKKCDDLFTITIDYDEMYDEYFDRYIGYLDNYIKDESFIAEVNKIYEENDSKTHEEIYNIFVSKGFVTEGKLISFDEFLNTYETFNPWCSYFNSYVVITPKSECTKEDIVILNKINDLFYLNAQYDG